MCLAIPGKILEASSVGLNRIATVQFGGITRQIYLDFVPDANPGDYVLAHVGFALSVIDQGEAERTYALLEEMGALAEDERGER
ncbi:MAG: HypC/HybG/HupF family hydrogenase formation chaperone [Candidatus Sulfopaludibacter sp.]|nr:HypC/HybG/HupF family hydrogenase formation chaperone [Candidatus Sulfopaludibacter sp.]